MDGAARRTGPRFGADEGSTILLTIGFAALALALVLVGVAATSVYVEHKRLLSLADMLASTAAESFSIDDVLVLPDGSVRPVLDDARVQRSVVTALAESGHGGLRGVDIDSAVTVDGRSAEVSLSSDWRPPMLTLFVPEGVRIQATASARSVFW